MINQNLIEKKFEKIGAKVKFRPLDNRRFGNPAIPLTIDVKTVKGKEGFEISYDGKALFQLAVIDLCPEDKHIVRDKIC